MVDMHKDQPIDDLMHTLRALAGGDLWVRETVFHVLAFPCIMSHTLGAIAATLRLETQHSVRTTCVTLHSH